MKNNNSIINENLSNEEKNKNFSIGPLEVKIKSKVPKVKSILGVNSSLSSRLLLSMSVVFLAVCLSSSMIVSSVILSKQIKESGLNGLTSANTPAVGTTTATASPAPAAAQKTVTQDQVKAIFSSKKYITFGNENSKVLFVEAGDPSCPYCHIATGENPELNKQVGTQFTLVKDGGTYVAPVPEMRKLVNDGKASFTYIYTTGHGNGKLAMQALYCAYDKGKFWEAHDLLLSNAGYNLQNNDIKNDVAQSGKLAEFLASAVDKDFMKSCLESKKYESRVASDEQFATGTLGVQGTPGFFVNTIVFSGAYNWNDMKTVVETALK